MRDHHRSLRELRHAFTRATAAMGLACEACEGTARRGTLYKDYSKPCVRTRVPSMLFDCEVRAPNFDTVLEAVCCRRPSTDTVALREISTRQQLQNVLRVRSREPAPSLRSCLVCT